MIYKKLAIKTFGLGSRIGYVFSEIAAASKRYATFAISAMRGQQFRKDLPCPDPELAK